MKPSSLDPATTQAPCPRMALAFSAFLALIAAACPAGSALAQGHSPSGIAPPPRPVALADTGRVRRWREDVRFITGLVRARHPRPFAFAPEASFDSAALAIERRIPVTEDADLAVECMRMVSLLGDGHSMAIGTRPELGFNSILPVLMRPFEDGLYVTAADSAHAALVGCRVTRLGTVAAAEAVERVGSVASGDNRYTRFDRVPVFLMVPRLLRALGLSDAGDRVTLEVERSSGRVERVEVAGGPPPPGFPDEFLATEPQLPAAWRGARVFPAGGPPRCDRRPEDAWWFEFLPASRSVYLRMRRIDPIVARRPNPESYRGFYPRLFALLDSLRPAALIVDLRHDHGGNNNILDPLIRGIVQRPWLDREGGLFALIDRGTFSAAMNAAVFLEGQTRVTFVGEPTGGRLNHYGDAPHVRTPNLGIEFQVSTVPWMSRYPQDGRPWIAPGIAVPSSFAGWANGGDAALDAALDAIAHGTRERRMLDASARGGPEAAAAACAEWNRLHPNPWSEGVVPELTGAMSARMDDGDWLAAAALGEALVRIEPGAAIGWRVLGEAQLGAGHRARGIECLRETVRLNPQARVARMMLRQLGEEP